MDPLIYQDIAALSEEVIENLRVQSATLATAESCTGGNIAHNITLIAGCSDVFMGGAVTYSNESKANILGVDSEAIESHGAVSREVVEAMAAGARRAFHSDYAVATSGIAGPGGGTDDKPVGTVWTAIATPDGSIHSELLHLNGSREEIITKTTFLLLQRLVALTK